MANIAKSIRMFVRCLVTPNCWLQNYTYSPQWDRRLNELMASHKFVRKGQYTAMLGDVLVWVANHPYASFTPYGNIEADMRPSRSTMLLARDKLMEDMLG